MVKKKVLWIEGTAQLGGAQYNHILLQEYRPEEWESEAILPEEGPLKAELEKYGVNVHVVKSGPSWSSSFHIGSRTVLNPFALVWLGFQSVFIAMPKYYNIIRKVKPDLVVTNSMVAHIFGGFASKLGGYKLIFRLEDILRSGGFFQLIRWKFKFFFRFWPDGIIVPSKSVRDLNFKNPKVLSKAVVIYNSQPFSEEAVVEASLKKEHDIQVTTIGIMSRLTPWKGHKEIIQAFKKLSEKNDNLRLLIVGGDLFAPSGYLQSLMDLSAELDLNDRVIFTGFRRDLRNCIESFDIAVLPSILPDPCPRVLFEFMERSKPIVATNLGGAPEILEDGKSGLIRDPFDETRFVEAIQSLIDDTDKRKTMGKEARLRLEDEFPFEKYLNRHYDYFKEIADN